MMKFPTEWKNKTCSKPPTSYGFSWCFASRIIQTLSQPLELSPSKLKWFGGHEVNLSQTSGCLHSRHKAHTTRLASQCGGKEREVSHWSTHITYGKSPLFLIGDHLNWTMIVYKCIHTIGYIFIADMF